MKTVENGTLFHNTDFFYLDKLDLALLQLLFFFWKCAKWGSVATIISWIHSNGATVHSLIPQIGPWRQRRWGRFFSNSSSNQLDCHSGSPDIVRSEQARHLSHRRHSLVQFLVSFSNAYCLNYLEFFQSAVYPHETVKSPTILLFFHLYMGSLHCSWDQNFLSGKGNLLCANKFCFTSRKWYSRT